MLIFHKLLAIVLESIELLSISTHSTSFTKCLPLFITLLRLGKELYFLQNAEGSGLAPFDCWLCLRGIKTMALRVEKQQVLLETRFQLEVLLLFIY